MKYLQQLLENNFLHNTFFKRHLQKTSEQYLLGKNHYDRFRSSRPEVLYKKGVFKIFQNSQENTCGRVPFQINLQTRGLHLYQKRNSGTGVFQWILRNL